MVSFYDSPIDCYMKFRCFIHSMSFLTYSKMQIVLSIIVLGKFAKGTDVYIFMYVQSTIYCYYYHLLTERNTSTTSWWRGINRICDTWRRWNVINYCNALRKRKTCFGVQGLGHDGLIGVHFKRAYSSGFTKINNKWHQVQVSKYWKQDNKNVSVNCFPEIPTLGLKKKRFFSLWTWYGTPTLDTPLPPAPLPMQHTIIFSNASTIIFYWPQLLQKWWE